MDFAATLIFFVEFGVVNTELAFFKFVGAAKTRLVVGDGHFWKSQKVWTAAEQLLEKDAIEHAICNHHTQSTNNK